MSGLLALISLPFVALAVAISILPVWFAAQVVGAGRSEFLRVALSQLVFLIIVVPMLFISPWTGVLLSPVIYMMVVKNMLETSYLGAFVLMVLAAAFQVCVGKLFGGGGSAA